MVEAGFMADGSTWWIAACSRGATTLQVYSSRSLINTLVHEST